MKRKRMNAVLSLLSIIALLIHIGYSSYCYLAYYYNPFLKYVFSIPVMVLVALHAVLSMWFFLLHPDGSTPDLYPEMNKRTHIQRISAILILPALFMHLYTYHLLQYFAQKTAVWLILAVEVLFFGTVFIHTAVSFSRAWITLGIISSSEAQKKMDRAVYMICLLAFVFCICSVVRVQIMMFAGV